MFYSFSFTERNNTTGFCFFTQQGTQLYTMSYFTRVKRATRKKPVQESKILRHERIRLWMEDNAETEGQPSCSSTEDTKAIECMEGLQSNERRDTDDTDSETMCRESVRSDEVDVKQQEVKAWGDRLFSIADLMEMLERRKRVREGRSCVGNERDTKVPLSPREVVLWKVSTDLERGGTLRYLSYEEECLGIEISLSSWTKDNGSGRSESESESESDDNETVCNGCCHKTRDCSC